MNQEQNPLAVYLEFPESVSDKKQNKEKKEDKITIELLKNQALIGSQDVVFTLENKKAKKNNEFKKWLSFNFSTNNNSNNSNLNVINNNNNNNSAQNALSARGKDGKRGSLTGMSLLNFNEFVKIHVTISKIDEESKQKFLLQQKLNEKEDDVALGNNKADDKEVYISIQENDENNNEINSNNNNINNNNEIENPAIKAVQELIIKDKEIPDLNQAKTNSANAKGKGKNRSNLKQSQNSILTEGNNEEAKDKKLKDSAKSKNKFFEIFTYFSKNKVYFTCLFYFLCFIII